MNRVGLVSLLAPALVLVACSSSAPSKPVSAKAPTPPATDTAPPDDTQPPAPAAPTTDACGTIPADSDSMCTTKSASSIVRGVVTFDPPSLAGKTNVTLRVFMNHQFIVKADEAQEGGHPHAWVSVPNVDVTKGSVDFAIDLCEFGTAMYSEEDCGFNIVTLFDTDGSHDPDKYGIPALIPKVGDLVKMTPVNVSCHQPSQCLAVTADCTAGSTCVTYTGLTSCKCTTPSCPSDSVICTN
jgi:hypothetical protein